MFQKWFVYWVFSVQYIQRALPDQRLYVINVLQWGDTAVCPPKPPPTTIVTSCLSCLCPPKSPANTVVPSYLSCLCPPKLPPTTEVTSSRCPPKLHFTTDCLLPISMLSWCEYSHHMEQYIYLQLTLLLHRLHTINSLVKSLFKKYIISFLENKMEMFINNMYNCLRIYNALYIGI